MTQKSDNTNKFWKGFHKVVLDSGVLEAFYETIILGHK